MAEQARYQDALKNYERAKKHFQDRETEGRSAWEEDKERDPTQQSFSKWVPRNYPDLMLALNEVQAYPSMVSALMRQRGENPEEFEKQVHGLTKEVSGR